MAHEDDGWVAPAGFNFTRDVVEHFATDPRRTALTFVDGDGVIERRTFAQVAADAARWAHLLRGSGYQPGDRVLALLGNVPETTGILLGAIKCGLVVVPCPEPMVAQGLAFRARQTGASVLIADRSAEIDVDDACAELETEIDVLFLDEAEALLKRCRPVAPTEITSADHYPFILYTSGVTKAPKGVAHTHAATHAVRLQAKHWLDVGPGDIVWCSAGNWWGHSIWNVLGPWSFGAEIVMHAGGFDPAERLELLEFLGVSILGQTAREYGLMAELDHLETSRPSRLRHAVSAGEPLRPAVIARFHEAFGIAVHNGYGQAENALLLAGTPSSASQLGSMGLPIRGHHLAVVDEDGREMPLGEEGEIGLQGRPPTLFDRYWGAPEETEGAFRGPWYLTGDRATRDEDGNFWFMGRADDVIVSADHRVGAFEVESALLDHPAVAESAVVGKPGADHTQTVKAFVVLRAGFEATDELAGELRAPASSDPAAYTHPREIEFVTKLPRTADGKIRRVELRRLELERAGVAEPPSTEEAGPLVADDRRAVERGRRHAAKEAKRAEKEAKRVDAARRRQEARARAQAEQEAKEAEKAAKQAEQARLRAEAEERARLEEAQRRAEQEAREAEAAQLRAQADERRRQEKAQQEAEQEARRADQQARKAEQARVLAEAAERLRQEEAKRRAEQRAKRSEAPRMRAEAKEQARLQQAQRRADEEARKAEASRVRAEAKEQARLEEAQRRADEEARKTEASRVRAEAEEQARLEEAQQHAGQQAAREAEAERLRAEEDQRRRSVKEEREAERERLRLEHERLRETEQAVRRAEEEERRQAEEALERSAAAGDRARRDETRRAEEEAARRASEEAKRRREVEAARRKLEQAERKRRRSKPRPPERTTTRSQTDDEESELGTILVERLQAYGHGEESGNDA